MGGLLLVLMHVLLLFFFFFHETFRYWCLKFYIEKGVKNFSFSGYSSTCLLFFVVLVLVLFLCGKVPV